MSSDFAGQPGLVAVALVVASASVVFAIGVGAEEQPDDDDAEPRLEADDQAPDVDDIPAADGVSVVYQGVLQNVDGDPVGGVFPLTFHLYRGSMSAEPIWRETHFVSVVDGRYQVTLGEESPLREHLLTGERWLGVELDGEQELLRDQILVDRPDGADGDIDRVDEGISHAERATEAERARVAETAESLDGMTAAEIEQQTELALERLGDHIADPDAHDAVAGPTVGDTSQRAGDEVGGTGGTSYELRCPEGYVATGIEGGAGRVVDSITLLCSPLD